MYSEYSGGPQSTRNQIVQLLAPAGSTVADGFRLAAINGLGLVVVSLGIGLISLFMRILNLPHVIVSFGLGVACIAVAVFFWFRFAEAYGKASRVRGRGVRPDVYGAIAGIPFALVGLLLFASGFFGLFLAMVTFSLSRAGDGFQRLLFAIIFIGLAVANVIIARAAND